MSNDIETTIEQTSLSPPPPPLPPPLPLPLPLPRIREFDGRDWQLTKTSRRNLPHWELDGSTYFITSTVLTDLGKPFLTPEFAELMVSILLQGNKTIYDLYSYVIMPDHIHIIIKPYHGVKLSKIMQNLKGSAAYKMNKMLKRTGKFWQDESFDHLIRDAVGLRNKWEYIKNNPVVAKLVNKPEEYPYSSFYMN